MSGSNKESKTSDVVENQLPLKGFHGTWISPESGRKMLIEGMGSGRFRIHAKKGVKRVK